MKQAIALTVLFLALAGSVAGQDSDDDSFCRPANRVMSQVVSRIIRSYFKPRRQPRNVYISDQAIQREWIPPIRNTRFIIVPEDQVDDRTGSVFVFDHAPKEGKRCVIYFGIYDPGSGGEGDIWYFRVAGKRIRVWNSGEHWGSSGNDTGLPKS